MGKRLFIVIKERHDNQNHHQTKHMAATIVIIQILNEINPHHAACQLTLPTHRL